MMRQTLDEALRNAAHRKKGCALFMIDLDRFKNVNDTLGHPVGDALLRQVAERLKSVMGNHGQVGRLGGDEFQAVLPGAVDIGLLESLARTLIEQVSRPYMIEGNKVTIGASVGIVIGDPGRASADALVRNADLALYAAKGAGRGKHRLYEPSMHSEAAERQLLENDLRQAIERGELSVHYQPIVRTAGEEVSGFESLVRWQHPTRGADLALQVHPACRGSRPHRQDRRMGAAHRARRSGALARPCPRRGQPVAAAVQRSATSSTMVAKHLEETGVRAERLELEITEGVFLAEGDSTDETFAKLKALGVRLALDDFGTGYSSLGYLKKAPFDKIKIDQSFVRGAASTDQPQRGDHPRDRHPCRDARHGYLRRGRRDPRRSAADPRARRQHGPGLHFRKAEPGRNRARDRQQRDDRGRRLRLRPRTAPPADAPRDDGNRRRDGRAEAAQYFVDGRAGRMSELRSRRARSSRSTSSASGPVRGIVRWAQAGKFGRPVRRPVRPRPARAEEGKDSSRDHAAAVVRRAASGSAG